MKNIRERILETFVDQAPMTAIQVREALNDENLRTSAITRIILKLVDEGELKIVGRRNDFNLYKKVEK